jgi:hypothetical protein
MSIIAKGAVEAATKALVQSLQKKQLFLRFYDSAGRQVGPDIPVGVPMQRSITILPEARIYELAVETERVTRARWWRLLPRRWKHLAERKRIVREPIMRGDVRELFEQSA